MSLQYLPAGIDEIAVSDRHPWFAQGVPLNDIVIFFNDEPFLGNVVAASAKRGALRVLKKDKLGNYVPRRHAESFATTMLYGRVELFIRKDSGDVVGT
jgi:hypothetical protein